MKKAALPFTTISVVGLGLMGTSLIEACEDAGTVTAYGMGRNPVSIQKGSGIKYLLTVQCWGRKTIMQGSFLPEAI